MSNITVTVLTIHGRRQTVPVSPHTTLLQILEEVCKKYEFNSEDYCLKHHNKEVDLSLLFRYSGLPNKCLLEMEPASKKRQETDVVICVQLENGERHQGQFLPNENLKTVLQKLAPAALDEGKNPVVVYMRAEIYGEELENKTLKGLGITRGRAMFRILNKNPEELKVQANVYIPPSVKSSKKDDKDLKPKCELESNNKKSKVVQDEKEKPGITVDKIRKNLASTESNNEAKMELDMKESEEEKIESVPKKVEFNWDSAVGRSMNEKVSEPDSAETNSSIVEEMEIDEPEVYELGERNAVVFSLDTAQKVPDNIPDSFFDLTVDDLKVLLRDLHKVQAGDEDAPLLTAKLREIDENNKTLAKLANYKKCVIRIQFPDRLVLQGTFSPVDKIENIYEFVRNYLKDSEMDFHLFTIPPKKVLKKDLTLLESNCVPTAVLHFGIDNPEKSSEIMTEPTKEVEIVSYLKEDLQQSSANGAILAASKSRGIVPSPIIQNTNQLNDQPGPSNVRKIPDKTTGAIPKQPKSEYFKKSSANSSSNSEQQDSDKKVPKWFKSFQK